MIAKSRRSKKGSRENLFFSTLLGILVLGVIGFLVVSNLRMGHKRAEFNSRIESLKNEIWVLEEEKRQLQAQISQSSQEFYLEKEARERFNLKKPGEEVVTILPPEEGTEEPEKKEKKWLAPLEALLRKIF